MPGNSVALPIEDAPGGDGYPAMVEALRDFLDALACAGLPSSDAEGLAGDLRTWTETLVPLKVPERERIFGRRADEHGRGQTMSPQFVVDSLDDNQVSGRVTFGSYFLGGNGAVHGGAIPLLLDEILGRLSNSGGRSISRTAYLHTDYRSITPIGVELQARARFVSEEGRKRVLRGEICDGDTLCAEAEGLFIALRHDQP